MKLPRSPSLQPRALIVTVALLAWASSGAEALRMKPAEVQHRYRAVLSALTLESESQALDLLYDLETGALPEYAGSIELERFWRLKLQVVRELLDSGKLEQLVPIIVLHHNAFAMYRERRRPLLAAHSRTMASELAEILADRSEEPEVHRFAGWVLTSFGSYLQESRSISGSAEFFERALALAPGNRSALLGLAASHEKYGEYEEALVHLQRSHEMDASDSHVRLRLALNLARVGSTSEASGHLEALTEPSAPEWIRSLAFQELARLKLAAGEREAAVTLLRQAVSALPEHQQPRIQLAVLLELDRRSKEARQLLEGVQARPDGESARYRYDQWPTDGLAEGRQRLQAMMQQRLTLLADGLRRAGTEKAGP